MTARPGALTLPFVIFIMNASAARAQAPVAQPADSVVAVVLGEEIERTPNMDGRRLLGIVLQSLTDRYGQEHDLEPTEEEIDAYVDRMIERMAELRSQMGDSLEVPPEEEWREAARKTIRRYKINRALYEQYGGRVIFQQLGPEPIDAYRAFLEEQQESGSFRIVDPSLVEEFWAYLTDDRIHSFYPPEEAERVMTRPWWLLEPPPDEGE